MTEVMRAIAIYDLWSVQTGGTSPLFLLFFKSCSRRIANIWHLKTLSCSFFGFPDSPH